MGRGRVTASGSTQQAAVAAGGSGQVHSALVDLADEGEVRSFADQVLESPRRAGWPRPQRWGAVQALRQAPDGTELTVATHVLAPFRLSRAALTLAAPGRGGSVMVTVTSGGMYTQRFDLDHLEMTAEDYRGVTAYARAKRAQVVLADEWARRWGPDGVANYADPSGLGGHSGLSSGLPSLARLGTHVAAPGQGADTIVWLRRAAANRSDARWTGDQAGPVDRVWHDRPAAPRVLPAWDPPAADGAPRDRLWDSVRQRRTPGRCAT